MSSEVNIALQKVQTLRDRARHIEHLVRTESAVPRDLQIDNQEMVALERHIGEVAARRLGVPTVDKAIWRPFWLAAYEDWDRSAGPMFFWEAVNRHLVSTEQFLLSLTSMTPATNRNRRTHGRAKKTGLAKEPVSKPKSSKQSLRLFISHSAADADIAAAVIDLLRAALNLEAGEIRCTSVDGYRLPAGASTDDRLRREVYESAVFIGLVSKRSMASPYVVFELGARWGAGRQLIPLLAPGTSPSQLGGPLQGINALSCDSNSQLLQLVSDVGRALGIQPDTPSSYTRKVEQIIGLRRRGTD